MVASRGLRGFAYREDDRVALVYKSRYLVNLEYELWEFDKEDGDGGSGA
jgi:hypothetical protein